jgi:hypothetical protein
MNFEPLLDFLDLDLDFLDLDPEPLDHKDLSCSPPDACLGSPTTFLQVLDFQPPSPPIQVDIKPVLNPAQTTRKRARKGRGRHRHRPRACELPQEELQHQRKLARQAATRRRASWLEERSALEDAMAVSVQHAKELESEQQHLRKELAILRDVVCARARSV